MENYKINLIKEKYGVDLEAVDFNKLSIAETVQWGEKIHNLERRLMSERFHETLHNPHSRPSHPFTDNHGY